MNERAANEHTYRLPKTSLPISYNIYLKSSVYSGSLFSDDGELSIKVKIAETTDHLILHSRELNIENLRVLDADDVIEVPIINYRLYASTDNLTIYLVESAPVETE